MSELASKNQLRMSLARWVIVVVPLILVLGTLSGVLSNSGMQNGWYRDLQKPALMPPGWAFGLIWAFLYLLMGVAVAMILDARGARNRALPLIFFTSQLALNLAWSPSFFLFHQAHFSVFLLALIWLLTVITCFYFATIRPIAAWLLVPYLMWLSIAAILAYQIDALNPNAARRGHVVSAAPLEAAR